MKVLIVGDGKKSSRYLGAIENAEQEECVKIALDSLEDKIDGLRYKLTEISQGSYKSLESGKLTGEDIINNDKY